MQKYLYFGFYIFMIYSGIFIASTIENGYQAVLSYVGMISTGIAVTDYMLRSTYSRERKRR